MRKWYTYIFCSLIKASECMSWAFSPHPLGIHKQMKSINIVVHKQKIQLEI